MTDRKTWPERWAAYAYRCFVVLDSHTDEAGAVVFAVMRCFSTGEVKFTAIPKGCRSTLSLNEVVERDGTWLMTRTSLAVLSLPELEQLLETARCPIISAGEAWEVLLSDGPPVVAVPEAPDDGSRKLYEDLLRGGGNPDILRDTWEKQDLAWDFDELLEELRWDRPKVAGIRFRVDAHLTSEVLSEVRDRTREEATRQLVRWVKDELRNEIRTVILAAAESVLEDEVTVKRGRYGDEKEVTVTIRDLIEEDVREVMKMKVDANGRPSQYGSYTLVQHLTGKVSDPMLRKAIRSLDAERSSD